jgi:hypothetical protein
VINVRYKTAAVSEGVFGGDPKVNEGEVGGMICGSPKVARSEGLSLRRDAYGMLSHNPIDKEQDTQDDINIIWVGDLFI